jgi:hypothetical protein
VKRLTFIAITALLVSGLCVTEAGAVPVRSEVDCGSKKGKATCIGLSADGEGASATAKGSTITLTTGYTDSVTESAAFAAIRNFWDMPLNDIESLRLSVLSVNGNPSGGSPRISMYVGEFGEVTLFLSPAHCAGFDATSTAWQTVDFVTGDCTIHNSNGTVYNGWDEVLTALGSEPLYFSFVIQDEGPAKNQIKISVA